ncbi:MAG TPA: flagellar export protein FliJ [Steroidobacteraceae bacterium]|nr:flagellar export protein FliJ [Steroidobacteraceae bacterium]
MTQRAKRLEPVKDLAQKTERVQAERLARAQRRASEARGKLQELQVYLQDYQNMFNKRARGGMSIGGLRDYQVFIARLQEALQQQQSLADRLAEECAREHSQWLQFVARTKALGKAIDNARADERKHAERKLQSEIDERALRGRGVK